MNTLENKPKGLLVNLVAFVFALFWVVVLALAVFAAYHWRGTGAFIFRRGESVSEWLHQPGHFEGIVVLGLALIVVLLWLIARQLERNWEQLWEIQSSIGNVEDLVGGAKHAEELREVRRRVEMDEALDNIREDKKREEFNLPPGWEKK